MVTGVVILAAIQAGVASWLILPRRAARYRLARLTATERAGSDFPLVDQLRWANLVGFVAGGAQQRARLRRACVELCFGLAAELYAGRTSNESVLRAVSVLDTESRDSLRPVVVAAGVGDHLVAEALRATGDRYEIGGLRRLAACWEVGSGAGAGFAAAIERLAHALQAEEGHRDEVGVQLAGPRATARLLAVLPALGLLMAMALGVRPLSFLTETAYGAFCLIGGIALDVFGLVWTRRIAGKAEELP